MLRIQNKSENPELFRWPEKVTKFKLVFSYFVSIYTIFSNFADLLLTLVVKFLTDFLQIHYK